MANERFASIWDAIEDTPEEAANMRLRSKLMMILGERVKSWNVSQAEAGCRLGLTQPRVNDLLKGRISKFSLDALVNLSTHAHYRIDISVVEDETAPA
ncbi:MAG: XRE family transcriptional regulator [Pseudomonadota bacterium]|mgnify:FL=1|jgi:predicted XRE-type DNA-binding protein|uniref:helix-turn-helix domain-containing protein n=1 Tax=Salinicola TaxID=404432 RepID=UPI000B3F9EB2|nr:XRE family transcriptional regulator [Salinicola salarius]MED5500740.1 XRE family transcriptional regulator [Pseudomonadota bacterium]